MHRTSLPFFFFFFNDTATTEIYTLSLHDALPIYSHYFRRLGIVSYGLSPFPLSQAESRGVHGNDERERRQAVAHDRSEEHTSELQSQSNLVCRLLLEKKKKTEERHIDDTTRYVMA